ncbi:MAG: response regulator transcription factor [Pseudomonadota bacterium]
MSERGTSGADIHRADGNVVPQVYTVNPDPVGSSVTARSLASAQIRCQNFTSPAELLKALPLASAACLMFDFVLPEMSGLQLLERLRRRGCFHPVVFTSTRIDPEVVVTAMNRGAFGFIKRPFNSVEIVDTVQRALILDQSLSPYIRSALDYRQRRERLSKREHTVLALLELGRTAREIGGELNLSVRTVENHRARIFQKLNIRQSAQLMQRVTSLNLLRAQGTID